ncbi:PQQ-binding-like beta-propeller repeat protein [Actinotalea sp. BY-33]|uniref:PQQ-binding-like beta-propeller repeat protein n=1 Tax=Actinotalea soli TaxID=2819234 RepID=A0A939LPX0_9CELL|nr:PQQ-binding-like beta-propeller repeat protein [Actinotalea soli]MBO1752517.1 PQQ-binding-like beta-propeller repeat protein [Actinotalea soli]
MRRRDPGGGVVQVELVEADADHEVNGVGDGGGGDTRETGRARRLRRVGLAVILVGTIVTAMVVDARQNAARRVELAELGWVLPPVEGPLEEVWRSAGGWTLAHTDELFVLAGSEGGVRALDPATGAEAWTHDGAGANSTCSALLDYREARVEQLTADIVYCYPIDVYQERTPAEGVAVPIDFIEVATGTEISNLVVDGSLVVSDMVDGDLLVTFVDSSAALGVRRWDPRAGEVWSYRSAPGFVPNGVVLSSVDAGADEPDEGIPGSPVQLSYGVADGAVRLTDAIALDLATGEQVTVPPLEATSPNVNVWPLPDGGSVEVRLETSPDGGWSETGRVLDADGSLRFATDGIPRFSWQTDGSDAGVLTVFRPDGRVAGIDPETGQTRWSAANATPAFVLEDVMVLVGSAGVLAIDVHDGEERWHAEEIFVWNDTAATDGDVVLVQSLDGAVPELVALDLLTGAEAWRIPITGITGSYWRLDHRGGNLLLLGDEEILALG